MNGKDVVEYLSIHCYLIRNKNQFYVLLFSIRLKK